MSPWQASASVSGSQRLAVKGVSIFIRQHGIEAPAQCEIMIMRGVTAYLLKRISHQVSDCGYMALLSNSMNTTEGLLFDHRIPVRLEKVSSRGSR
jgi:hypothetical protein